MSDNINGHSDFIATWRGVAVLIVVYAHFAVRLPPEIFGAASGPVLQNSFGKLGVHIFFIISGFLIARSIGSCGSVATFYAKRLSRIWPLYILASTVVFVFFCFFEPPRILTGDSDFYERLPEFRDYVATIFFANDLGFQLVDGAFWTILVELKFYFWIALFAYFFREKFVQTFANFTIVLATVDLLIIVTTGERVRLDAEGPFRIVSALLHGVFISQYLPFFAVGLLLYARDFSGRLSACVVLMLASAVIAVGQGGKFNLAQDVQAMVFIAVFFAFDYTALKGRLLVWVGDYSYSIYLFHQAIGVTLMKWTVPMFGMSAGAGFSVAASLLMGWIGSQLAEWRFRQQVYSLLYRIFSHLLIDRLVLHLHGTRES